jgi:hypothetical protein
MDTRIKENTVHINEKNWTTFERLAKANNILYDATISKLYKGYTEVEFYSTNDYSKMKTLMNKHNVFYKDRFNEALRNYIRNIINEFKF